MKIPEAPEEYSPEHCTWVHRSSMEMLDSAMQSLTLVAQSQQDLTKQTISALSATLKEIREDQINLHKENEKRKQEVTDVKLWVYGGLVTAIIFLVGLAVQVINLSFKFLHITHGAS